MNNTYETPLGSRYASPEMLYIFSPDKKFKTWRRLWIALAEAEKELGLDISDEQIAQLKAFADDINYDVAKAQEKKVRHDVMSHVFAFGEQAPLAKPIIHLGATSCFVGDNTDVILMNEALALVKDKLINVLDKLSKFAVNYKDMPTLGFTHYQPAQLTTVGKRSCLLLEDLLIDFKDVEHQMYKPQLRGVNRKTQTQSTYLNLFDNDHETVKSIYKLVAMKVYY